MSEEFSLPDILENTPMFRDGNLVRIGLLEVGCRSYRKPSQLRNKKQLFYKHWADKYTDEFFPEVYRILAHYNPDRVPPMDRRKFELDVVITYTHLDRMMLSQLSAGEREELLSVVKKRHHRDLESTLEHNDSQRLKRIIGDRNGDAQLRGRLAEFIAFHDIRSVLPEGVSFVQNGFIKYYNRTYGHGTEVDGFLTMYLEDQMYELVQGLRSLEHCVVRDRFQ